MKKLLLSAILLCGIVMLTMAGPVETKIIPPGGPALTVTVLSGQVLHILNFVADTPYPGNESFAQVTIGSHTATVMRSINVQGEETHIVFNLAGPATLRVNPHLYVSVTISYKVDLNM